MSLESFQTALAYVIRFYDEGKRKNVDEIASQYQLSDEEKYTLEQLIHQQQVKAYSEEMFIARWRIIDGPLSFLHKFVDHNALKNLWEHDFEQKNLSVNYEDLVLRFVEYLVTDEQGYKFITTNTPPYLPDIIKYIYNVFTFSHNTLPKPYDLPLQSFLTDRYFRILDLDYDVREFCIPFLHSETNHVHAHDAEQGHECFDHADVTPPPKTSITLLFVAEDNVTEFRSFEIDSEVKTFLLGELNEERQPSPRPPCYDDLVAIGLCKPLNTEKKRLVNFH